MHVQLIKYTAMRPYDWQGNKILKHHFDTDTVSPYVYMTKEYLLVRHFVVVTPSQFE